ncbi:glycosyltransferase, partial [Blyttiomyces helicus]
YPAGFVYVYSALHELTSRGKDVLIAQYLFAGLHVLTLAVVYAVYWRSIAVPQYVIPLLSISKRVHSIYVLRLFNDPVAMLPLYLCILAMVSRRWTVASVLFSLALSIKMNILLFAPGFALLVFQSVGFVQALFNVIIVVLIQILLALPFLLHHPASYLHRAFDFSRAFLFKWTVNWRFVGAEVFSSRELALGLLALHALLLVAFGVRWCRPSGGIWKNLLAGFKKGLGKSSQTPLSADHVILVMFTSNLIGILCARSLHYQFFSWYWHTLPYLLWRTRIPVVGRLALLITIEVCWNVYPSTTASSLALLASHVVLLAGLMAGD